MVRAEEGRHLLHPSLIHDAIPLRPNHQPSLRHHNQEKGRGKEALQRSVARASAGENSNSLNGAVTEKS